MCISVYRYLYNVYQCVIVMVECVACIVYQCVIVMVECVACNVYQCVSVPVQCVSVCYSNGRMCGL